MNKTIYTFLLLPFASFIIGYAASYFFFQKTVLIVPSIIGKPLQSAVELLSKNRLGLRLRVRREDVTLPEGVILDQLPEAGQRIRPNQNVFVTVSARPKPHKMIDGWAKRRKGVVNLVKERGLEVSSVYVSSHYPDDLCIAQCPLPEKQLTSKKVTFYFSDGTPTVYVIPDFRNNTIEEVESALDKDSVEVEVFHRESMGDGHHCSDCIIRAQYPLPGEIVDLNKVLHVQFQVELS